MDLKEINKEEMGNGLQDEMLKAVEEKAEEEDVAVFVSNDTKGKKIIGIIKDDREYYLNSRYDVKELVENWCEQCDVETYGTIAIVFGLANAEYIRALRSKNPDMLIMVVEPAYSVLYININEIKINDLMDDGNIIFVVGKENYVVLYDVLRHVVDYTNIKYTKLLISPNYDNIFPEELEDIKKIVNECLDISIVSKNTMLQFGEEVTENICKNLIDCIEQYSLYNLIKVFQDTDIDNMPAILVAAGPSLDKNINDLKKAQGRAFIVAVDTALNSLANGNIIPDMTITVDSHKPLSLFENPKIKEVPMLFSLSANEKIKELHSGIRIYQDAYASILNKYIDKLGKEKVALETGGSVANDAFSLIRRLGFRTVILVGLDLAYPEGKVHSESAYGKKKSNILDGRNRALLKVEDIYGNVVITEYNMNMYRLWFERQVEKYPDIKFIDATEGGAKKKGMEILTLKEAIERECMSNKIIDFGAIIHSTEKRFNREERKYILNDISNLPSYLEDIRKRINEGIKMYEKLDELNRKQKYTGREFENVIKRVSEINDWMTNDSEVGFLHIYAAKRDYKVRENVLDKKENIYEEFKFIASNGIEMMDALLEATYRAEEDMKVTIQEATNKLKTIYSTDIDGSNA